MTPAAHKRKIKYTKARRAKDNKPEWRQQIKKRFGLTERQYLCLLKMQRGRCAICNCKPEDQKSKKRLCVDHDHQTKKIRGLLCDSCNRGLGLLKDNLPILLAAVHYLRNHSKGNSTAFKKKTLRSVAEVLEEVDEEINRFRMKYFLVKTQRGLNTQEDVARVTGIDRRHISRIERGHKPRTAMIERIAKGFGVSITELI